MRIHIKHRNMTDVSFQVWEIEEAKDGVSYIVQGLWYNMNGFYHDPRPFAIATGSCRPAVETIRITKDDFLLDWDEVTVNDA